MLGLWLAEKLGIVESEIENYAKEVVLSDLDEPGIEDLVRKVTSDIQTHGADIEENEIREKLDTLKILQSRKLLTLIN